MDEFLARLNNPFLNRIINLIPTGETAYLVGGAIRDALLNRSSYDLDFVIPGNAMQVARKIGDELGAAYFPLDTRRNMARLMLKPEKKPSYVDTYQRRIDISSFQGADLLSDLHGRDFTLNAMAVDVHALQTLIDPLGGAADLVAKRLRACSPQSILDDPVRILRAVRFSIDLELIIQPDTLQLIRQAVGLISNVSIERLRDELFRILVQSRPGSSLRVLDKLGALEHVLPDITQLKNIQQSPPHTMDVWGHTFDLLARLENILEVLATEYDPDKAGNLTLGLVALRLGRYRQNFIEHFNNSLNPDRPHRGILFLAGLYHDVGKLKTQKVDEKGKIRFIEHEQVGGRLVEKYGIKLRLSNHEIDRLGTIVKQHMRPSLLSHGNELPSKKAIYRFFRDTGDAGIDICLLSIADLLATYGPTLPQERLVRHLDVVRELLYAWWEQRVISISPPILINGDELMEALGLSPGPLIGYLLDAIREAQVADDIQTKQDAINLAKALSTEKLN